MKQESTLTGINAPRLIYLVSAFILDKMTMKENIELNNWLEGNPENCALFNALTSVPSKEANVMHFSFA